MYSNIAHKHTWISWPHVVMYGLIDNLLSAVIIVVITLSSMNSDKQRMHDCSKVLDASTLE